MVEVLPKMDKTLFEPLLEMLQHVTLTKHYTEERCKGYTTVSRNYRKNFPEHRASIFGVVKCFGRGKIIHGSHIMSFSTVKYPDLYKELKRLGDLFVPFQYSSILVNNNTVCGKHYDSNNVGMSCIISIGDYTGCKLVVENVIYDAHYQPLVFNGAEKEHWNTNDLIGNKYSIVYYYIPNPIILKVDA